MATFAIVEGELFCESNGQINHAGIALEVDILVLDAPPEPFHEDVVQGPAPTIYAEFDPLSLECAGEGLAGELHPLVAVEDRRCAEALKGILKTVVSGSVFTATVGRIRRDVVND